MSNAKIWEINDDFEKFNEFYRSIYKAHQRGMPSPPASLGASGSGSVFLLSCPRCQLVLGSLERGLPCLWIVCRCVRSEWSDLLALGWLRCAGVFVDSVPLFPQCPSRFRGAWVPAYSKFNEFILIEIFICQVGCVSHWLFLNLELSLLVQPTPRVYKAPYCSLQLT